MQHLWFKFIRKITHIGLWFYFKKIEVIGRENIPKGKAILFTGNHRNGLIDPILIATSDPIILHFLTRASAFKNKIAAFLLKSIHMIPIYRIRDGIDSISKNQAVFELCYDRFNENESVLIFPEGNHGEQRNVRPLTKGFTRIAFGYLDKNPDKELLIIPVGLNFTDIFKIFSKVSVIYAKPISVRDYYNPKDESTAIELIKQKVFEELKKLTTHIENKELHNAIDNKLKSEGDDFLNPTSSNKRIVELEESDLTDIDYIEKPKSWFQKFVFGLFYFNSLLPIYIWRKIKPNIEDIVLISTFRFGLGVGLLPLFYILQSCVIGLIFGGFYAFSYLISSFALVVFAKITN